MLLGLCYWLCCIDVGNVLAYISQWKANIGHRINASALLMFARQ